VGITRSSPRESIDGQVSTTSGRTTLPELEGTLTLSPGREEDHAVWEYFARAGLGRNADVTGVSLPLSTRFSLGAIRKEAHFHWGGGIGYRDFPQLTPDLSASSEVLPALARNTWALTAFAQAGIPLILFHREAEVEVRFGHTLASTSDTPAGAAIFRGALTGFAEAAGFRVRIGSFGLHPWSLGVRAENFDLRDSSGNSLRETDATGLLFFGF
jgi:hypothetical protein